MYPHSDPSKINWDYQSGPIRFPMTKYAWNDPSFGLQRSELSIVDIAQVTTMYPHSDIRIFDHMYYMLE